MGGEPGSRAAVIGIGRMRRVAERADGPSALSAFLRIGEMSLPLPCAGSGSATFTNALYKSRMRSAAITGGAIQNCYYVLRPFCYLCFGLFTGGDGAARASLPFSGERQGRA